MTVTGSPLTAEKVATYLPLSGSELHVPGRIINVSHQIPYHILRTPTMMEDMTPSQHPAEPEPVKAAPISKLARHHRRGQTLRVKFHAADWTVVQSRGNVALFAGLHSLRQCAETIHIGWTGPIKVKATDEIVPYNKLSTEDLQRLETLLWEKDKIWPLFLDSDMARGHYEGYCKEVLWPLFHYLLGNCTNGRVEKRHWEHYKAVNQIFADKVITNYQKGDTIFIHDYHLLLVPAMIREQIPDATIGIFIHAPFPSSEMFRCLTTRREVLMGMLGADMVGFQTYSYARHFIASCTRVLGCESTIVGVNVNGHSVSVATVPIGIDADRVHMFCKEPGVRPKMDAIRAMYQGKKIIVGRDKLDSTKGVLQKLRAFEIFLRDYPEWRNKIILLQVTTPTHDASKQLEKKISEMVHHINGLYGSLEFTPVHHYHQDIDRDEFYAVLSTADVGLITSVRDGMNTTSLEYIICQHENHGPLILSEFTGTAGSLSAALMVNPWDYEGVARAINDALVMSPEEKRVRHEQLYRHVREHSVAYWAHSCIKRLVESVRQTQAKLRATPALSLPVITEAYKSATKRLIFLDYDGTLTPIVSRPCDAQPSEELLQRLQALCADDRNHVWVISGRDQATLDEWLGSISRLGFSAEHGCFLKPPGSTRWTSELEGMDMSWRQDVEAIFTYYTERTQGSFVEHKKSSVTWHYRMADANYGAFQAKECQNHLENAVVSKLPVEILLGKKNLEVRPTAINKGEVVKRILGQNVDCDFVLCAGDDKTDEDMFRMLSTTTLPHIPPTHLFAITVGEPEKRTMAHWHVRGSDDISNVLNVLTTPQGN